MDIWLTKQYDAALMEL